MKNGVGDRNRTCIKQICNLLPSLSGHTYKIWYQRRESNPIKNANLALKGV
jgi:hypothetical protein